MEQKVRGLLAYLFGWIGGLVILVALKDNEKQTKFNACQSIVISAGGCIIGIILSFIPFIGFIGYLVNILTFALLIFGMVRAYQEEDFEVPVISDLTRSIFKNLLS